MDLSSVTVIIRSAGERTSHLCERLIKEQGISDKAVHTVKESPFSKALVVSLEIGMREGRPWTLCIDADVLLRPGSIQRLLDFANTQSENVCEVHGFVLDKFFGGARTAGNHLYRTCLIHKMIELIPSTCDGIRPEASALNLMKDLGHPWVVTRHLVGLHDFEQAHADIVRKCFVQAHKHLNYAETVIPYWRSLAASDSDYKSALLGFSRGILHYDDVRIDKNEEYYLDFDIDRHLEKKDQLNLSAWSSQRVEDIIQSRNDSVGYRLRHPDGVYLASNNLPLRVYVACKNLLRVFPPSTALRITMAWLFGGLSRYFRNPLL